MVAQKFSQSETSALRRKSGCGPHLVRIRFDSREIRLNES